MRHVILIIFFGLFFLGPNLLNTIGVSPIFFFYSQIVFALFCYLINLEKTFVSLKGNFVIGLIFLILLLLLYRYFNDVFANSFRYISVLLATPIFFFLIPKKPQDYDDVLLLKGLLKIILIFFVFESCLAIVEYVFKSRIFLWIDTTFESNLEFRKSEQGFRSVALHGSPLTNALLITVINSFIITSSLKDVYKFSLWCLGFVAVFCFNARIAILINCFFAAYYLFELQFSKNVKIKVKFIMNFIFISFSILMLYMVFALGLGDRILGGDLLDESSGQKRIELFEIFDYYPIEHFLYGVSVKEFEYIQNSLGILIIENFWVCMVMLYGVVFVVGFVLIYYKIIKYYCRFYVKKQALLIVSSFLVLASINNSLFSQYLPLLMFLVCLNLFRPRLFRVLVLKKFLK